jgi:hypothetical protein
MFQIEMPLEYQSVWAYYLNDIELENRLEKWREKSRNERNESGQKVIEYEERT